LEVDGFRLGIVDVPGHERFVKNMLAGATGVDLALLVVAADDSVMPQTREHLEILRLLGLRHGLIALTKCDLVDDTTREVVELEVRELVHGSFLENAPLISTSTRTGAGLEELKAAITGVCRQVAQREGSGWFRLAIDRSFIVQGHGTVVTGSVVSGSVRVGEEVEWLPRGEPVRVRSLQNHGQPVNEVHRGMRAAVNLAGVHHADVRRGQELARPGYLIPSRLVTVRLHCLAGSRPIKHRLPIRLHIGTAEVLGFVALLDCDLLEPDAWGLAQLFLEDPVLAVWGQPFVIRKSSATETLGGGQVLQPAPRRIRRRHQEMLKWIERLWRSDVEERILAAACLAGWHGIAPAALVRDAGAGPDVLDAVLRRLLNDGRLLAAGPGPEHSGLVLHPDMAADLEERILEALAGLHTQAPLVTLHDRHKLAPLVAYVGDDQAIDLALERLLAQKRIVGDLRRLARSDFRPRLTANLHKLKDKMVATYREAGLRPSKPDLFANQAGGRASDLDDLLALCVVEGQLVHITEDIYLHREVEQRMRQQVIAHLVAHPGQTVAQIRDCLGTGRRHAILICEYLDRIGVTRRQDDLRWLAQ
jgi:selenocysteine-specific elongation factor